MRNLIGLLIILMQFSCAHKPSDHLTFKVQYQPQTKFKQITERTYQTVMKFSGSVISLQRLRARGIQNPTLTNKNSSTETIIKTGKRNDGNNFPVTLEYIKTTGNDGKTAIPDGTTFKGICIGTNMPRFNSVESAELMETSKPTVLQTVQNTFSQLSFPIKELKIGEQFSVEYPLDIPMERSKIEMVVTSTYKLTGISNNIASFDISQEYAMNPVLLDNSFEGSGKGKGTMLYDISNTIILSYTLNNEMNINKKLDSFDFNLKTKSRFIQTTGIQKD